MWKCSKQKEIFIKIKLTFLFVQRAIPLHIPVLFDFIGEFFIWIEFIAFFVCMDFRGGGFLFIIMNNKKVFLPKKAG